MDIESPPRVLKPRSLLVYWFIEYNPFYLLSAACMLGGLLAITNSLSWSPIAVRQFLRLILTLNLYEAALLGIALFLVVRRKLRPDGRFLLILQAFFLVDFAYLNAEVANLGGSLGIAVNVLLLGAAILKLGIVTLVLKPRFTAAQFAFVILQIAILFAIPCLLAWMEAARWKVGPRQFYILWWIAALIPALYEMIARVDPHREPVATAITPIEASKPGRAAPIRCWLALPYVALLVHMGILHYVHDVRFYGAHAAPALLGLTLVLNRFSPTSILPRKDLLTLRLILPAAAILVSLNNPFSFHAQLRYADFAITPLHLAASGAFLLYVYMFLRVHARLLLTIGAAIAAMHMLGPSRATLTAWCRAAWEQVTRAIDWARPRELKDWGIVALAASFILLGIGFWFSLMKRPQPDEEDPGGGTGPSSP